MRWDQEYRVGEVVDDRRGPSGRLGFGSFALVVVLSLIFHRHLFALLEGDGAMSAQPAQVVSAPLEDNEVRFVSFLLDDTQGAWARVLPTLGVRYERAPLVLFTDAIRTPCGATDAHAGPFYCPNDQRVYLDLGFFSELRARFHATGDFAQAYVIAHEVGHHVQRLLGINDRARALLERNPSLQTRLAVGLELQADCFAGVWASATQQRDILEGADLDEALAAAATVADERAHRGGAHRANAETWTHGTAVQRASWFRRGWTTGDARQCITVDELGVN